MKKLIAGLCLVLFVGAGVWVLSLGGPDWQDRKVLVFGRGDDTKHLDPIEISDGESVKVCTNLYETLVRVDFDGQLAPGLAEKWEALDGRPGYRFAIRVGVKFHDGTPLTPEAVKKALDRLLKSSGYYRAFFGTVKSVSVEGARAVTVELSEPDATFLRNLAMFPAGIPSPTAVELHGQRYGLDAAVGTGPFKLASWVRDQKVVLERWDGYWGPKAKLAKIEFQKVRDNSSRFQLLRNGDLALIDNFNPQDLEAARRDSNLVLAMRPPEKEISLLYLAMNTAQKPLDNALFRQAVAHSIDKDKLAKLYHGAGRVAHIAVPPGIHGHSKTVSGLSMDHARARKLLEESGVKERSFKLTLMANPRPYIPQPDLVARAIADSLSKIGITLELEKLPWKTYLDLVENGRHQMCLLGWTTDNGDADNFLSTFYHSSGAVSPGALNVAFYKDKEMDELLAAARRETDEAKRATALEKVYRRAAEQSPIVPLIYARDYFAHRKELEGVRMHPLASWFLQDVTFRSGRGG